MKKSAFSVIAGTYAVHNYTMIRDGVPGLVPHWGTGINGVITYSPTGWVTTSMASNDSSLLPTNLTYPSRPEQSDADWAKIGRATLSYAGPYTVEVTSKTTGIVSHGPLIAMSVGSGIGAVLVRNYTIFKIGGDTYVELSFATGAGVSNVLWWRKLD